MGVKQKKTVSGFSERKVKHPTARKLLKIPSNKNWEDTTSMIISEI
jgi:hypothetical protein